MGDPIKEEAKCNWCTTLVMAYLLISWPANYWMANNSLGWFQQVQSRRIDESNDEYNQKVKGHRVGRVFVVLLSPITAPMNVIYIGLDQVMPIHSDRTEQSED